MADAPTDKQSERLHSHRPPSYVSRATLAAELDISESTVDEMVRRAVLPRPIRLSSGCVRWRWQDVEMALASLSGRTLDAPVDPYLTNIHQVAKAAKENADKRRVPRKRADG